MTFTLISVVYACGIAKPGHGSFTPLVVGLSLVACAGTGACSRAAWGFALLKGPATQCMLTLCPPSASPHLYHRRQVDRRCPEPCACHRPPGCVPLRQEHCVDLHSG